METTNKNNNYFAYTIHEFGFSMLAVKNSANAWWLDKSKVTRLIQVFRLDGTIPEACFFANITLRQYKYFAEHHPVIKDVREQCKLALELTARKTIIKNLHNPKIARWYLEMVLPEEFGREKRYAPTK